MNRDTHLVMRDLMDQQIVTADDRSIARVADIEAEWRHDGRLYLTGLDIGPQALARRVSGSLAPIARFLLRGRWEHTIPMDEVSEVTLDVYLRHGSDYYETGKADQWVVDHILRFIPGNGRQ